MWWGLSSSYQVRPVTRDFGWGCVLPRNKSPTPEDVCGEGVVALELDRTQDPPPVLFPSDVDAQRGGPGLGVRRRCPGESLINPGFKRYSATRPLVPPSGAGGAAVHPPPRPAQHHSITSSSLLVRNQPVVWTLRALEGAAEHDPASNLPVKWGQPLRGILPEGRARLLPTPLLCPINASSQGGTGHTPAPGGWLGERGQRSPWDLGPGTWPGSSKLLQRPSHSLGRRRGGGP